MAFFCSFPLWTDGHVSACMLNNYLGTLLPLTACLISMLLLLLALFHRRQHRQHRSAGFQPVPTSDEEIRKAPLSQQCITTLPRPTAILEAVAILANICVSIVLLLHGGTAQTQKTRIAALLIAVYVLLLLVGRSCTTTGLKIPLPVTFGSPLCCRVALHKLCHACIISRAVGRFCESCYAYPPRFIHGALPVSLGCPKNADTEFRLQ